MKKITSIVILGVLAAFTASAHVVVKPSSVGIGAFQTFTMGVPAEKSVPTVSLKLILPDGLSFVTPNVKSGWKVEVKTQSTGKKITNDDGMMVDEQKPVEIDWTGGSIPAGQRDEFAFSAQVPSTATTLEWKAYQTYQDGSVVSWDRTASNQPKDSKGSPDFTSFGPFSTTMIVNDLQTPKASWWQTHQESITLGIALLALIVALAAAIKKPHPSL
jgi:uncharacterized protein YcnI